MGASQATLPCIKCGHPMHVVRKQIGREDLGKFHVITTGGKIRGDSHFHLKFLCIVSFFFLTEGDFFGHARSLLLCVGFL